MITVIIAAYNTETTLEPSVRSVLAQDYKDIEVLIVDDASKDNTAAVAQKLAAEDNRVKLISAPKNGGPAAARNLGLESAQGEWIAVVDSDDFIKPNRLSSMLAAAQQNKADIVFDNLLYIKGTEAGYNYISPAQLPAGFFTLAQFIASHRRSCSIPNMGFLKPLLRREILKQQHINYNTALKIGEDAMLIKELLACGAIAWFTGQPTYHYFRHEGSISARQPLANILALNEAYKDFFKKYESRMDAAAQAALRGLIKDNVTRIKLMPLKNLMKRILGRAA